MWTQTTRTLVALIVTLGLVATAAEAQDKKGKRRGNPLDAVTHAAMGVPDLSAEQRQKVKQVIADAEGRLMDLRDEAKAGDAAAKESAKAKVKQVVREAAEQVAAELTEPQRAAFREALKKARDEAKARRGEKDKRQPQT